MSSPTLKILVFWFSTLDGLHVAMNVVVLILDLVLGFVSAKETRQCGLGK